MIVIIIVIIINDHNYYNYLKNILKNIVLKISNLLFICIQFPISLVKWTWELRALDIYKYKYIY